MATARLPCNSPAAPSARDPVHTDVTNRAVAANRRNSLRNTSSWMALSVTPPPPGTQITSHAGMSASRRSPAKLIPSASTVPPAPLARITVAPGNRENTWCGPVKSSCVTPGNSAKTMTSFRSLMAETLRIIDATW
jgi:hypothetical protein